MSLPIRRISSAAVLMAGRITCFSLITAVFTAGVPGVILRDGFDNSACQHHATAVGVDGMAPIRLGRYRGDVIRYSRAIGPFHALGEPRQAFDVPQALPDVTIVNGPPAWRGVPDAQCTAEVT